MCMVVAVVIVGVVTVGMRVGGVAIMGTVRVAGVSAHGIAMLVMGVRPAIIGVRARPMIRDGAVIVLMRAIILLHCGRRRLKPVRFLSA